MSVSHRIDLSILSSSPRPFVSNILGSSTRSSLNSDDSLFALETTTQHQLELHRQLRILTNTRAPAEGLVHWTSTRVSLGSRPAFPPPADHQAIPPHEHLTHTSSPSIITVPQSVLHPAFAAESLLSPLILYLNPTPPPTPNPSSRSSPSLHKFHNTPRSVQRPSVPAPASFHKKPLVYIDDQFKISNSPRTH